MTVPANARRQVIQQAEDRCEYCGLSQAGQEATFHVDHIVPVTAGGTATLDNLALACVSSRTSPSAVANPPVLNSGGGELCFFAPCALGKSAGFLRAAQQAVGTDVAI